MKIVKIAKYNPGLLQEEALKTVAEKKLRLLTNKETDAILQDDTLCRKYSDYFPLWTGTHVEYDGADCTVTELGRKVKCKIPTSDGWHAQDQFGIPFGNSSNNANKDARFLWRVKKYSRLLARCYGRWDGDYRRYVGADYWPYSGRLGVLATPIETTNRPLTADEKKKWAKMTARLKAIDADKKIPLSEKIHLMREELNNAKEWLGD